MSNEMFILIGAVIVALSFIALNFAPKVYDNWFVFEVFVKEELNGRPNKIEMKLTFGGETRIEEMEGVLYIAHKNIKAGEFYPIQKENVKYIMWCVGVLLIGMCVFGYGIFTTLPN